MLVKDYYYGRILTYSAKLIRKAKESEQKRAIKNIGGAKRIRLPFSCFVRIHEILPLNSILLKSSLCFLIEMQISLPPSALRNQDNH